MNKFILEDLNNDIIKVMKDLNLIYHKINMNINKEKDLYDKNKEKQFYNNVIDKAYKELNYKEKEEESKIKTKINNLSSQLENKIDEPFIKQENNKVLKKRGRKKKVIIIDENTNNILNDDKYDSLIDAGIINV